MSDPFIDRLMRLEPDGGAVNRDALLIAAGRASARPNRGWQALAAAMTASQIVMIAMLLWPGKGMPIQRAPIPEPDSDVAPPMVRADPPVPIREDNGAWALRERLLEGDGKFPPFPAIDLVDSPEENQSEFGPLMLQHFEGHKR